jgi:predicted enzyme related to lactoylglutathione lyase
MNGLRTCIYVVSDLAAAKNWYSEVLDFPPYFDEPFYVGFEVGGYELGLMPQEGEMPNKTANIYTYWGVDDIETSYQRLLALGATDFEAPNEVGGGIIVATVKDPWDNCFGLIYNPHFSLH